MLNSLYRGLQSLKSGTNDETNGRHIIPAAIVRAVGASRSPKILDVGAGYGVDLLQSAKDLRTVGVTAELKAIESFPRAVAHLTSMKVDVQSVDIERDRLPFGDGQFDVVVCNQVLEHTKEIFWVVSELIRVVKVGGSIILGVPNLGSLHNRLALLAGYQPPTITVFGTHVRGFTVPGLRDFLETGSILKVESISGGNFYPFPPTLSRPLSRLLPSLSVSSFYSLKRVKAGDFLSVFNTERALTLVDTPYYRGANVQG